jgi:hypothetical protein
MHFLLGRLHGAKLAAAHRGELRHPLPVGFVYDDEGDIVKDPDEPWDAETEEIYRQKVTSSVRLTAVLRSTDNEVPTGAR